MSNISHYEKIIEEKRKNTTFSDFVMEIASWKPLVLKRNEGVISRYDEKMRVNAIDAKTFQEFRDSLQKFGTSYIDTLPFLSQVGALITKVPLPNILHFGKNENCDFADEVLDSKNVYLSTIVAGSENVIYSLGIRNNCTSILSSSIISQGSEIVYSSSGVVASQKIFYSRFITSSSRIWFSRNLVGCQDCIFCENLQNARFCINNKEYSEVEYTKMRDQILLQKDQFETWYSRSSTRGKNIGSESSEGNFIIRSHQIESGYFVSDTNIGKNLFLVGGKEGNEHLYDICTCSGNSQSSYGVMGMGSSHHVYCSCNIAVSSNIYYSYYLENCSFCIGCVGLKNKSYCILNTQYSKEEWEILAEKIFASMEADGTLGKFFPATMNPFYFNDTLASLIDDTFTKNEVEKDGYLWRDTPIKVDIPEGQTIVESSELEQFESYDLEGKWQIDPAILSLIISDERGNYYRIVEMEYAFLKEHSLPLPRTHWLDRIKMGYK